MHEGGQSLFHFELSNQTADENPRIPPNAKQREICAVIRYRYGKSRLSIR